MLQLLIEADVDGWIGAGRHERAAERRTCRNGYRERDFDTRLGRLKLRIPKLRQGGYFPPFLESRKTSEKALVAVTQEAWIGGVSTRKVDELAKAMGLSGISKSSVSRLCADIDERADAFPGQAGGLHVGPSEAEVFWSDFLKALRARGLRGVKLVFLTPTKA